MPSAKIIVLLLMLFPAIVRAAEPPVVAELLADRDALMPGSNVIGLYLTMQPGWHVYWRNPGASGRPPSLSWDLPAGIEAGDLQWPMPETERAAGLTSYVYSHAVMLPLTIVLPRDAASTKLTLKAEARWLACNDSCVPGHAAVTLTLPVSPVAEAFSRNHPLFVGALVELPQPAPAAVHATATTMAHRLSIVLEPASALGAFDHARWLPVSRDLVDDGHAGDVHLQGDRIVVEQALLPQGTGLPGRIDGILELVDHDGPRRIAFDAKLLPVTGGRASTPSASVKADGRWLALMLAFVGGLVLNLMPCVLPVLSIKALSLIETTARDRRAHRQGAIAYTVGVIGSCLALGIVLLALRAGGDAVGWGFQLQSPIFISLLAYLFFGMALSLSGWVEFGARWMGVGESLTHRSGWQGSLFTGMLAMLAASPCTAPFMGTALGYAATQPPLYAITVFALLGLGLATPFLLIAWFPLSARLLPRPGPWMNGFRKAMSIPLYLTVVWLIWILARQAGPDAAAMALIGLVALGVGVSLWQVKNWTARGTRLAVLAFALVLAGLQSPLRTATAAASDAGVVHEVWSAQRLSQLQSQGRTVFVNFTADWCLTCKVNERVALKDPRVQAEFARDGIVWLTADWTRPDPEIAEELARRGRDGVPLYVLFRPNQPPAVLPQILTPERVLESLAQAS